MENKLSRSLSFPKLLQAEPYSFGRQLEHCLRPNGIYVTKPAAQ